MAKAKLSLQAAHDLKEIWSYIAEDNMRSADKVVDELVRKCQMLANRTGLGRKRDELIVNLRSFPHKRYMIYYFVVEDGVEIFRIVHGSRDNEQVFSDMIPPEGED